MKTLILGLGNSILSDDGIGIRIAQEIRKRLPNLDIIEASIAGLSILDYILGYDRVILIDSIKTGKYKPGTVYNLKLHELASSSHLSLSHGIDFATVIELGKRLGYKIPELIDIYGVEVEDNMTFHEGCTEQVEASIPGIVEQITQELKRNGIY